MENDFPPMATTGPSLDPAKVAKLEKAIGSPLPSDYRAFLVATNGGRTADTHRMFKLGKEDVALNQLHRLDTPHSPLTSDGWRPDWFPPELLSIGSASGGIIAICLRGEHKGSIWYLDTLDARPSGSNPRVAWHDRRDFTKLAPSFLAFVSSLTPDPDPL